MLKVTDLRGQTPSSAQLRRILPRGGMDVASVLPTVTPIIDAVKTGGAQAALDYGEQFDRVRPASVRVPADVMAAAADNLDDSLRAALQEAIRRIRAVHAAQKPQEQSTNVAPGATITEVFLPVPRVGLYLSLIHI